MTLLIESYVMDYFDSSMNTFLKETYCYPVLKAFVELLDLLELVGNQNQIVPPGQWIEWT